MAILSSTKGVAGCTRFASGSAVLSTVLFHLTRTKMYIILLNLLLTLRGHESENLVNEAHERAYIFRPGARKQADQFGVYASSIYGMLRWIWVRKPVGQL